MNKNMKKIAVIGFLTLLILLMSGRTVNAVMANLTRGAEKATIVEDRQNAITTKTVERQAQKMESVKTRAQNEIQNRIDALNKLIMRVQAMKRLTQATKDEFVAQINAEIALLNTLKAKIEMGIDLTTIIADRKSIFQDHRVYMLFIPKMHVLAAADVIFEIVVNMEEVAAKLETKIAEAKAAGKDVVSLETYLADARAKMADAKTQAESAVAAVLNLNPDKGNEATMNANKTAVRNAHAFLKMARETLRVAREDGRKIVEGLRALNLSAPTSAVSPVVTSTMGL
jgi:hypothetical protein